MNQLRGIGGQNPAAGNGPKPAGMRTKTIAHKSFEAIEGDCAAWFAEKPVRQIIVIQTYPVAQQPTPARQGAIEWFTVIHYMLYL